MPEEPFCVSSQKNCTCSWAWLSDITNLVSSVCWLSYCTLVDMHCGSVDCRVDYRTVGEDRLHLPASQSLLQQSEKCMFISLFKNVFDLIFQKTSLNWLLFVFNRYRSCGKASQRRSSSGKCYPRLCCWSCIYTGKATHPFQPHKCHAVCKIIYS